MSFRVNFFPVPYVLSLILLVSFVSIFNETVYTYFSSNFSINGAIVALFIFCNLWILGCLAYFAKSSRLLSKMLVNTAPVVDKSKTKTDSKNAKASDNSSMVLKTPYSVSGTLFDTPVFSSVLSKLARKNRLEVSRLEAEEITSTILQNAARALNPAKFISSIFILLGLVGTFLGLLETIGGVAGALDTLASGGITSDIMKFIKLLSDPLQGMSTAFSASLFGLTSALVSNFGNHSAWTKVSLFAHRVRNYLISNTGVFDEDPTKVSVRDLLVSLEESFDLLYRGLVTKLEDVSGNLSSMTKVVARTHERQEKMMKVIIKDHEVMEAFWNRFLVGNEGVMFLVEQAANQIAAVLPDAMRQTFGPALGTMLVTMEDNANLLKQVIGLVETGVSHQANNVQVSEDIASILSDNSDQIARISEDVVNLLAENNDLSKENNDINIDANNILADFSSGVIEAQNISNAIGDSIVNILSESKDEHNAVYGEVLDVLSSTNQHQSNILRIVDERFGMMIGLASDHIEVSNRIVDSVDNFSNSVVGYYQQLGLENTLAELQNNFGMTIGRLDGIGQSLGEVSNKLNDVSEIRLTAQNNLDILASMSDNVTQAISAVYSTTSELLSINTQGFEATVSILNNGNEIVAQSLTDLGATLNSIASDTGSINTILAANSNTLNTLLESTNSSVISLNAIGELLEGELPSVRSTIEVANANTQTLLNSGISSVVGNIAEIKDQITLGDNNAVEGLQNISNALNETIGAINKNTEICTESVATSSVIRDILTNTDANISAVGNTLVSVHATQEDTLKEIKDIARLSAEIEAKISTSESYLDKLNVSSQAINTNLVNIGNVVLKHSELLSGIASFSKETSSSLFDYLSSLRDGQKEFNSEIANLNNGIVDLKKDVVAKLNFENLDKNVTNIADKINTGVVNNLGDIYKSIENVNANLKHLDSSSNAVISLLDSVEKNQSNVKNDFSALIGLLKEVSGQAEESKKNTRAIVDILSDLAGIRTIR